MPESEPPQLLAIVEVERAQRVRCGNPGCGYSVYKAIHIVQEGAERMVMGSTCYEKRYGRGALGAPTYGGGAGRLLTDEERALLVNNTNALLKRFAAELEALALARKHAEGVVDARAVSRRPRLLPSQAPVMQAWPGLRPIGLASSRRSAPWAWAKRLSSMAGFKLRDGSRWVRVQRADGQQMLAPWPPFDGWDEWLPAHLGQPIAEFEAYAVHDLPAVVAYLRAQAVQEHISGLWGEIELALGAAPVR